MTYAGKVVACRFGSQTKDVVGVLLPQSSFPFINKLLARDISLVDFLPSHLL